MCPTQITYIYTHTYKKWQNKINKKKIQKGRNENVKVSKLLGDNYHIHKRKCIRLWADILKKYKYLLIKYTFFFCLTNDNGELQCNLTSKQNQI